MNIVEIATAEGEDRFDILVQALTAANLVTTIQTSTDITVFAPTDEAFTKLAVDLGFTGDQTDETAVFTFIADTLASLDPDDDPIPLLTSILTYHVSGQILDAAAVTAASSISTLNTAADITPDVPILVDLEPDLINPALVDVDIAADNGILHVIDRVLLPLDIPGNDAPTIAGLVAASGDGPDENSGDFDLLLAALQTAELDGVLDTDGIDVTVFAPTDAAFIALAQDLGFNGSDEAGALDAIVATLTALGGGDPIPLLTAILTYHVSPGAKQLAQVATLPEVATLQGGTFEVSGTTLVDNEPDITDPSLVATDIQASNGIVHAIDRVLLPVDIPASNGANATLVLIADPLVGGKLTGGVDNDLLFDALAVDDLRGREGMDTFILSADQERDIIRDFEVGIDMIDVSAFAASIDDLTITNLAKRDGSTNWINVADAAGNDAFILRFGDGTALDAANLTADAFVFADAALPPAPANVVAGTDVRDDLRGTAQADVFELLDDDILDTIRTFESGVDQIDVSAFASSFDELTIVNRANGAGVTRWIDISDDTGETEVLVRFAAGTDLDAANLTADDFIFV